MITVNRYLKNENIPVRILACDYQGGSHFHSCHAPEIRPYCDDCTINLFEESDAARPTSIACLLMFF